MAGSDAALQALTPTKTNGVPPRTSRGPSALTNRPPGRPEPSPHAPSPSTRTPTLTATATLLISACSHSATRPSTGLPHPKGHVDALRPLGGHSPVSRSRHRASPLSGAAPKRLAQSDLRGPRQV